MKQYVYTERAHLMCPNMNYGIACVVKGEYSEDKIRETLRKLAEVHPFLRAVIGYEESGNRYYYKITDASKIDVELSGEEINGIDDGKILKKFSDLVSKDWNILSEGMLKIVAYRFNKKIALLMVFHHLLADGRAAFELADRFAKIYTNEISGNLEVLEERLIASESDLPKGSGLPFISKVLINSCNKTWSKENHFVKYDEYHNFADSFLQKDKVNHNIKIYDSSALGKIADECKNAKVSVNDYLIAKELIENGIDKVIVAKDIRKNLTCYNEGALGNYSTAFSVVHKTSSNNIVEEAKCIHKKMLKSSRNMSKVMTVLSCYMKMNPDLLDVAAISVLGNYPSKAGDFVGSNMFGFRNGNGHAITNLGKYTSDSMDAAMFIPPASPSSKKTLGVLTLNGQMVVCTSERDD